MPLSSRVNTFTLVEFIIVTSWQNKAEYDTVSDVIESKVHFTSKILTPISVKQDGLILLQEISF